MFFAIFIPFPLLLDFVSEFEKVQPTCDWKQQTLLYMQGADIVMYFMLEGENVQQQHCRMQQEILCETT